MRDVIWLLKPQAGTWRDLSHRLDSVANRLLDGIDHEDLLGASEADVVGLASDLGRVLGATHARGLTSRGEQAGPVIVADIGGRTGTFAEELQADATADLQGLDRDHALFVRALALYGPLLGADTPVADVAP